MKRLDDSTSAVITMKDTFSELVGKTLQTYRVQAGLSQQGVADRMDKKYGSIIGSIERGRYGPSMSDIREMLSLYGRSEMEFWSDVNFPPLSEIFMGSNNHG